MFRILIAEDEEPIANLIRMNLTRAGYLCTWAPDGKSVADVKAQLRCMRTADFSL